MIEWKRLSIRAVIATALFSISGFTKAVMDTKVFYGKLGFANWPDWFQEWMFRKGTFPVLKIDDGWHMMQLLCFLSLGIGYLLCGIWYSEIGLWVFASIPVRTIIHGIVFEATYPMK